MVPYLKTYLCLDTFAFPSLLKVNGMRHAAKSVNRTSLVLRVLLCMAIPIRIYWQVKRPVCNI